MATLPATSAGNPRPRRAIGSAPGPRPRSPQDTGAPAEGTLGSSQGSQQGDSVTWSQVSGPQLHQEVGGLQDPPPTALLSVGNRPTRRLGRGWARARAVGGWPTWQATSAGPGYPDPSQAPGGRGPSAEARSTVPAAWASAGSSASSPAGSDGTERGSHQRGGARWAQEGRS